MRNYRLMFIPTGNVFVLPEVDAIKFLKSDRGNYKILDEDFVDEVEEVKETTVYEQVVEEEQPVEKPKRTRKKK